MKHFIKKTVLMLLGTMMAVVASAQDFSKREASLSSLVSLSVTRSDGGDNQTAFPVASDEIISEENPPAGTVVDNLTRSGFGLYSDGLSIKPNFQEAKKAEIILGEDGNIYIKRFFSKIFTFSYLKLTHLEGDRYVAHTPQLMYVKYDGTKLYASRLVLTPVNNNLTWALEYSDDGKTVNGDVFFTYKDGVLTMEGEGEYPNTVLPKMIIGEVEQTGDWDGYGDTDLVFEPFDEEKTVLPEGVEPQKFILTYQNQLMENRAVNIKAYLTDKDFYFINPFWESVKKERDESQWIHGTIENGRVILKSQYVGYNRGDNAYTFFVPSTVTVETDEDSGEKYYRHRVAPLLEMELDLASQRVSATTNAGFSINEGKRLIYPFELYAGPVIQAVPDVALTPKAPVIHESEFDEDFGIGVMFDVDMKSEEGEFMAPEKLYFNVLMGEGNTPVVFTVTDDNGENEQRVIDVPYGMNDRENFYYKNEMQIFYVEASEPQRVGIQMVYKGGNTSTKSAITWLEDAAGIESLTSDGKAEFFDLNGNAVKNPKKGVYLMRSKCKDGKTVVKKVVR